MSQLRLALVNSMPDPAFLATERQFCALLRAAADLRPGTVLQVELYTMEGIPRSPEVRAEIALRYADLDVLWQSAPDAVILTGTEPAGPTLEAEIFWPELALLVDWSVSSTRSLLCSCLAAHAACTSLLGLERRPLARKCSGVIENDVVDATHPLVAGLPSPTHVPHSRLNDVSRRALEASRLQPLLARENLWSLAAGELDGCLVVLAQGHPEYSPGSLLREFERDLARYRRGERADPPLVPVGYLSAEGAALAASCVAVAERDRHSTSTGGWFPAEALRAEVTDTWRAPAARLYANWLKELERRVPPLRRGGRARRSHHPTMRVGSSAGAG
jgi:homoserine O-succinyltransferase